MSEISLGRMQIGGLTAQNYQLDYQLTDPEAGGTGRRKLTQADYETAAASAQKAYESRNANTEVNAQQNPSIATQQQEQSEQQQNWQRQHLLDSLMLQLRSSQTKQGTTG
jgi:hypothetical protein